MEDVNSLVAYFLSLISGGALYKIVSTINETRKFHAEARKAGVETDAMEKKIAPELTDMSIATMERVHRQLSEDYHRIVEERDELQTKFNAMKAELDAMQEQLSSANGTIMDLQERLQNLMDSLPKE